MTLMLTIFIGTPPADELKAGEAVELCLNHLVVGTIPHLITGIQNGPDFHKSTNMVGRLKAHYAPSWYGRGCPTAGTGQGGFVSGQSPLHQVLKAFLAEHVEAGQDLGVSVGVQTH